MVKKSAPVSTEPPRRSSRVRKETAVAKASTKPALKAKAKAAPKTKTSAKTAKNSNAEAVAAVADAAPQEAPKTIEAPKVDALKAEAPKADDAPKTGAPKTNSPKADAPAATGKAVEGAAFPEFSLMNQEEKAITLKEFLSNNTKGAILFTYPKANTPGCTTQACGFRDNYEEISKAGYNVFGISCDKPKSQENWKTKNSFQYDLLSDPNKVLISFMGASKTGGINRSHIIVGKDGKVQQVSVGVGPKDSVKLATEFVKGKAA